MSASRWEEMMIRHLRTAVLCSAFALLQVLFSIAQTKPAPTPDAPIPPQILAAKKVFIANAGGDEMAPDDPIFTGGPARAYNEFYSAVKSWGRFEIVNSPSQADLLLEIRQEVQMVSLGGKAGDSATPLFHLNIRDPKTNSPLWGFHFHAAFATGQANSDRNFDSAIGHLLIDLQMLLTPQPGVQ
jgi:hypothetical protein